MVLAPKQTRRSMEQNQDINVSTCNFIHLIFDKDTKNKTKTKTHKLEKRNPLHQMVPGKLDAHLQKYEIRAASIILYKNNYKWIKDLNMKPGTQTVRGKHRQCPT